jgi:hypothetical protein
MHQPDEARDAHIRVVRKPPEIEAPDMQDVIGKMDPETVRAILQ